MKEKRRRKIPELVNRKSGGVYIMERENSRNGMETLKREPVSRLPYRIRLLEDFLPLYAGPGREYVTGKRICENGNYIRRPAAGDY